MLIGETTILTALSQDVATLILKWVNDPEIKKMTGTTYPISEFEHADWIDKQTKSEKNKLFLIREKHNQEPIGTIGLKQIDFINRNAELYISIGEEKYRSHGYGTDAVKTLLNFCFTTLNLHKVFLKVFAFNAPAIKSYEKAGFCVEGILKEHHFYNGIYHDVYLLGIINKQSQ